MYWFHVKEDTMQEEVQVARIMTYEEADRKGLRPGCRPVFRNWNETIAICF
jgi:hypothetical protein